MMWDVVLGRESWGTSVALFIPPTTSEETARQASLQSVAQDAAVRELENMDDAALQALFDRSTDKREGDQ